MLNKHSNALFDVALQVLVVEDNEVFRTLLGAILENSESNQTKFELTYACTLSEAIELLTQIQFHVVLLDLNLPDSIGLETFENLYHRFPQIPIVILSASESLEIAQQAVSQGAQDYLVKRNLEPEWLKRVLSYSCARYQHVQDMARANNELTVLNRMFKSILNSIGEGVIVSDEAGRFILLNDEAEKIGFNDAASLEERVKQFGVYYPDEHSHFLPEQLPINLALKGVSVDNEEMFLRNEKVPSGLHISVNARPMLDSEQKITGSVISFRDISERRKFEKQLMYDATHDSLTTLPNRTLFMDRLEQRILQHRRSPDKHFALLFLDLDRFKNVNDSWGHSHGDKVLIEVAQRLTRCLRAEDTVARLGGDEFVLLLHNLTDPLDAVTTAERIQELFQEPLHITDRAFRLSASIGIVLSTTSYSTAYDLLRNADIAMYAAKANGKACHAIFGEEMHQQVIQFVEMENNMRNAIQNNEFELHYQPIVSLENSEITGFEALIRWFPKDGKPISPGDFIPIAESTGLIVPIGWWVLNEACRQLSAWNKRFPDRSLTVSVNISARQFSSPELVKQLDDVLAQYHLEPGCLKLEITETAIMDSLDTAREVIKECKQRNIDIYMDDFGTGYSSLSYLHKFPVDVLKIDRSFVCELQADNQHIAIVQTIASLARNLKMKIVAEGVETEEQCRLLRGMEIPLAQGYFFSKPLAAEEATALLIKGLCS